VTECRQVRSLLSGYLDAALAPAENRLVEEHIGACSGCHAHLQELVAIDLQLRLAPPPPVPADLTRVVMARLQLPEPTRPLPGGDAPLWAPLFAAAAAATLFLLGLAGAATLLSGSAWLNSLGEAIGLQTFHWGARARELLTAPALWPEALLRFGTGLWVDLRVGLASALLWAANLRLPLLAAGLAVPLALYLCGLLWIREARHLAEE
jgi:anti-sigma factor RsiW